MAAQFCSERVADGRYTRQCRRRATRVREWINAYTLYCGHHGRRYDTKPIGEWRRYAAGVDREGDHMVGAHDDEYDDDCYLCIRQRADRAEADRLARG